MLPSTSLRARIASLDVFRGLVMLVMIFVNDLASVRGLPGWTYHMPARVDAMTYVDMVFPAFLFVVGMSLPLATRSRLTRGATQRALWTHILARTASLLVLGLALANAGKGDGRLMPVSPGAWGFLVLTGAILFWNVYPKSESRQTVFRLLKLAGLLLMVVLFACFRRVDASGHVRWLDFSYWEILGLIGWTYLATCLLYVPLRAWRWAPAAWLAAACLWNVLCTAKWLTWPSHSPFFLWPFHNGAFLILTLAGVVTAQIFLTGEWAATLRGRMQSAALLAFLLLVAGWLLTPLGISKIRATPTWCLYSAGASVLLFLLLFWICDVRGQISWAASVKPAGANTLLTYLLPDLFYFGVGWWWLGTATSFGWPGVVRAALFTVAILLIAAVLTRRGVRLQL